MEARRTHLHSVNLQRKRGSTSHKPTIREPTQHKRDFSIFRASWFLVTGEQLISCSAKASDGLARTPQSTEPTGAYAMCFGFGLWVLGIWLALAYSTCLTACFTLKLRPWGRDIEPRKNNLSKRLPSPRPIANRKRRIYASANVENNSNDLCACTIALSMTLAARKLAGQNAGGQVSMQAYNPYPPGILPSDLNPEIEGVRRERRMLEQRALERWHDLKPPLVRGQPPTLQNTGTEAIETLGELMNYDQNISPNKNEACSFRHMPYAGFSGPIPSATQASPTTTKAAGVRITQGPEIERADPDFAIIRWTSNNLGGSPEHYRIVRYGTNPMKLTRRRNRQSG